MARNRLILGEWQWFLWLHRLEAAHCPTPPLRRRTCVRPLSVRSSLPGARFVTHCLIATLVVSPQLHAASPSGSFPRVAATRSLSAHCCRSLPAVLSLEAAAQARRSGRPEPAPIADRRARRSGDEAVAQEGGEPSDGIAARRLQQPYKSSDSCGPCQVIKWMGRTVLQYCLRQA
jgi:hypothetical protein